MKERDRPRLMDSACMRKKGGLAITTTATAIMTTAMTTTLRRRGRGDGANEALYIADDTILSRARAPTRCRHTGGRSFIMVM